MLNTKIVATLGPACADPEILAEMLSQGVDVVRVNCSHGSIDEHLATIARVRDIAGSLGRNIAVLADLQGPKIRVGDLDVPTALVAGAVIRLRSGVHTCDDGAIPVVYPAFAQDLAPGNRVLLHDGLLECRVISVQGNLVTARVVIGGMLGSRKGINMPGVTVSAATPTAQDFAQLGRLVTADIDYVAMSFVRDAADVLRLREELRRLGSTAQVVAKLELPEAIANLGEVLAVSDAVMVARGDLGVELGVEHVPAAQKRIIAAANAAGVPVITATEMLESMITCSRPTRAEASDVANAVFDGTGAVMLSAETASGMHPIDAVRYMRLICDEADQAIELGRPLRRSNDGSAAAAVARAVRRLVVDTGAVAVVCLTETGASGQLVATPRPGVPVLALTESLHTQHRCALYPGVTSTLIPHLQGTAGQSEIVNEQLLASGLATPGESVIVVSGPPRRAGRAGQAKRMYVHLVQPQLSAAA